MLSSVHPCPSCKHDKILTSGAQTRCGAGRARSQGALASARLTIAIGGAPRLIAKKIASRIRRVASRC